MTSSQQLDRIFAYFPDLTDRQKQQLAELAPLYQNWNEKINVISRRDIENIYLHHVLHSLAITKVVSFNSGAKVLDVGTGGGFPGIPLAILFPETQFHLVDSIGKKINVVKAVADSLALKNVSAEHIRAEKVKGSYDFIVTRAVARLSVLLHWCRRKMKDESNHSLPNGLIALKGGDLTDELKETNLPYRLYELSKFFNEDFLETKKIVYVER
ncbi:16S rRNA (guanine(527)-N(7))-methyltransferase RsmG [Tunicatimonas pelagia]|uniref:16S rRNA (guanine(527)-N(7))-methyltransferase RsmG n=1 Tax=Tunicatimonas pelagia TaxID=931531 RepID=UPI002665460B|nr:16S rRNA (guanine(527)-N(7))-methyltransferase RsmG [Tunicatimonas pelagia]WKN41086.1 16S rRNA (guanine(527)-N(7))-methyltransferase RsmG [Tunicatimonas pelagia]